MSDEEETGPVEGVEDEEAMVVELLSDVVRERTDSVVFVVESFVGTSARFWYSLLVSWSYCVARGLPLFTMFCSSATQRAAAMKNAISTGAFVIHGRYCFRVLLGIPTD